LKKDLELIEMEIFVGFPGVCFLSDGFIKPQTGWAVARKGY